MFVYFARFISEFQNTKCIIYRSFPCFGRGKGKVRIKPLAELLELLKFSAFLQGIDEGGRKNFVPKDHFFILYGIEGNFASFLRRLWNLS